MGYRSVVKVGREVVAKCSCGGGGVENPVDAAKNKLGAKKINLNRKTVQNMK